MCKKYVLRENVYVYSIIRSYTPLFKTEKLHKLTSDSLVPPPPRSKTGSVLASRARCSPRYAGTRSSARLSHRLRCHRECGRPIETETSLYSITTIREEKVRQVFIVIFFRNLSLFSPYSFFFFWGGGGGRRGGGGGGESKENHNVFDNKP